MKKSNTDICRCAWVTSDPLYLDYHDQEWGVPIYDDRLLFEFLILEGMQAGLSWLTILKRRANYRECFEHFDAKRIATYKTRKIESLLKNPGIIRNRLKVLSIVSNAQAYLQLQQDEGSLAHHLWGFVDHKPIQNNWKTFKEVPATTEISDKLSKDLKKRGFKFVGSTICYAFMQAVGMVNDHTIDCFRHTQVKKSKS